VGKTALAPSFYEALEGVVRGGAVGDGSTGYALRS